MSRYGDEMVAELSRLLGNGLDKTAAKKDKEEKEEKAEKAEKKEKEDKKEKKGKKKKKAETIASVVGELVKLADELDELGATEASGLVDNALKVVVTNLEKEATEEE